MVREEIQWNHTNMSELKPEKAEKEGEIKHVHHSLCARQGSSHSININYFNLHGNIMSQVVSLLLFIYLFISEEKAKAQKG